MNKILVKEPLSLSFCSHGSQAFGWDVSDTLGDEHLTSTAAGVMRRLAVRRLVEPARWVPAAMNAMLFTVVTTCESSGPPSFAETSIRRANRGWSFAQIHRDSNIQNHTEPKVRDVRDNAG